MSLWSRKNDRIDVSDADDEPTSKIAATSLAEIIESVDGTAARPAASEPDVEPVGVIVPGGDVDQASVERQTLIQLCLYALDRARSGGVVERLEQGLAEVGVRALRPDGERFDPAVHEAGGAVPTEDPALDGIVAETEVVGFADRDRLLRAPIVTVYTRK
ncbi:nucleotide exchange factor GrpE [Amycolatopsis sp. 195334CR]|uniref:nucleotide exchange factor GrpE n=1 Tax=Amycolatopsis sp. 195334CR TaxID=2814588 RepID=UPI001A8C35C3|nr:nucleotide exchange factor GrpE [Amycolatopsis sp. 195334CR]MBN6035709.1 nucleotide exchange factor GrpE [Amycolatopsis sp. 195334CR]